LAVINIPGGFRRVWGGIHSIDNLSAPAARKHPTRNHLDLLLGQHPPGGLRKRGHRRSADTVGDNVAYCGFIDDGQIHRIGEGNRRPSTALRAMAASTVLRIESAEVQNLARGNWLRIGLRFIIWSRASNQHR
jgi:hypothetical protein